MSVQGEVAVHWFPGRWVAGVCMVLAPLLFMAGVLIRAPFHFFFPDQLQAFVDHPLQMRLAYGAFALGTVLLWPAVIGLAVRIGRVSPTWAVFGGALAMLGLFARTFHAGVDHLAFQAARIQGVEAATRLTADAYGAFHVFHGLTIAILFGWWVLAVGAWRTKALALWQCLGLVAMGFLPVGVLKGTTPVSMLGALGLCIAFLPLGIKLLSEPPRPSTKAGLLWSGAAVGLTILFYVAGELG